MKAVVLKVGLKCEDCQRKVKRVLRDVEGIESLRIDTDQRTLTVTGDVDASEILRRVRKVRKSAELWAAGNIYPSSSQKKCGLGSSPTCNGCYPNSASSDIVLKMLQKSGLIMWNESLFSHMTDPVLRCSNLVQCWFPLSKLWCNALWFVLSWNAIYCRVKTHSVCKWDEKDWEDILESRNTCRSDMNDLPVSNISNFSSRPLITFL